MDVLNIHERTLDAEPVQAGALIDALTSRDDRLCPRGEWPPMTLDRPLGVGARGGHGPIRYDVAAYTPGASIRFRFTGPKGFDGFHGLDMEVGPGGQTVLRHTLKMKTRGWARLSWRLVYRPLHDALMEDALATAERSLGLVPTIRPWSVWTRLIRWILTGGKARPQMKKGCHSAPNASRPETV